jgi:hypothetical protein
MKQGVSQAQVRNDVDARFLYMLLIGACEIFVTAKPISDVLFSLYEQENLDEDYADFLSGIIVRGLRPDPAS